jgi:maltokinase
VTAADVLAPELADLLREWLPKQRWYGGKGRAVAAVEPLRRTVLVEDGERSVAHVLLRVTPEGGAPDVYQLLVGEHRGTLPELLLHATLGSAGGATFYDGVYDHEAVDALLGHLAAGDELDGLRFTSAEAVPTGLPNRVMSAEQSNTSVVFGDAAILKLFRRVQPGANPDVEVTRALADAGSTHVARPLAWFDSEVDGEDTTLGLLQVFAKGSTEGWAMATASVRDLFAEADLHADEVGGDFAAESERLGAATAEVHALMRQALPTGEAGPEQVRSAVAQLHARLDEALQVVPDLEPYADALRRTYDELGARTAPVPVQRVHGDYHLGQVLRTLHGWLLLDFEGEPARPLAERTALMSPLRDVAGMLRSYDYAARHLLAERAAESAAAPQLAYRATEWADRNRSAFCDGYAAAAGSDPRDEAVLLRAFELDKAVYEVVYEARNRPSWLPIPLGSIERLARSADEAATTQEDSA